METITMPPANPRNSETPPANPPSAKGPPDLEYSKGYFLDPINYDKETIYTGVSGVTHYDVNLGVGGLYLFGSSSDFNPSNLSGTMYNPSGGNTNPFNSDFSSFDVGLEVKF
jgi:hypothetical protein